MTCMSTITYMAKGLTPADLAEAAAVLREVLALVESGDLSVTTPREVALVRRLEGAATSLEKAADD